MAGASAFSIKGKTDPEIGYLFKKCYKMPLFSKAENRRQRLCEKVFLRWLQKKLGLG